MQVNKSNVSNLKPGMIVKMEGEAYKFLGTGKTKRQLFFQKLNQKYSFKTFVDLDWIQPKIEI